MKKLILLITIAATCFTACQKAEEMRYNSNDNIYFDFMGGQRDSLIYTFANFPGKGKDTVYIPVRIAGIRADHYRKFTVVAEPDSSTAVANLHYEPFAAEYTIPAGQGFVYVPLVVLNKDPMLQEKSVSLKFKLTPSKDFGVNLPTLIKGKLVFSSKLEHPGQWWSMWMGGYYSQTKHQFFIIVTGLTELSTAGLDAPKNQYIAGLVSAFQRDPFKWVEKNPSKGFVIEEKTGTNPVQYEFYSNDNPARKTLYRKSPNDGLYYFIDEFGQEVR